MSVAVDYGTLLAKEQPEVAHEDAEYRRALDRLAALLVRDELSQPEEKLVELLTLIIKSYEKERFGEFPKASGVEVLKHLMEVQNLKQKDLVPSVFETESVASEVLRGNRDLTVNHIKRLSERFDLKADAFVH